MNYESNERRDTPADSRQNPGDNGLVEENRELKRRLKQLEALGDGDVWRFANCALIAEPSGWSDELESLGVHHFKRPEALYKDLRSRAIMPDACIVDLDSLPRNLVKAVDIRVPCPKLWVGASAANPADIKNIGVYYSRARPDELNIAVSRLVDLDQSTVLPQGIVGKHTLPFLVADPEYRERLSYYTDQFAGTNLITLHGDDSLELQLVAQSLAIETQRARIWEVKSEASIHTVLRKIGQARRPGTDVSIVLSRDIDTESAREFYKSMPSEYSMIKLSDRSGNPADALSFTLPRLSERPADVENWIAWFVCRSSIEQGIALAGFTELAASIARTLDADPGLEAIRSASERAVRQHGTMMEDRGDFMSYEDLVRNYERTILRQTLTRHQWNLSAAAKSLGLAESSLRYKLNKLGLHKRGRS